LNQSEAQVVEAPFDLYASENSKIRRFYHTKMNTKYKRQVDLCLAIMVIDLMASEIVSWADPQLVDKRYTLRMLNLLLSASILGLIFLKFLRDNVMLFKGLIFLAITLRMGLNIAELALAYSYEDHNLQAYRYGALK
jgi:hypothetical protein